MIVKNTKREKNTVTFDVELDAAEFEKHVNEAYRKNRGRIMVPGFRKGKAPRMVIEGMYGSDVFYDEAMENAANEAFAFGAEQEKLNTVGRPGMTDSRVTEEKGAVLSFQTDVWPEVTLGQYKGLEAAKESAEVTDEEIAQEVERMRKQNGRLVTVERPAQNGDTVNIDYKGTKDGVAFDGGTAENYNLVLGSGSFIPGFEEKLVGISAQEERDLDLTFPEEYHAADLAGKAVVFHVKCNEVKFEELPELDDEFAKDNDFDTLDALKADIRSRREEQKKAAADNAFADALVEAAIDNMTVEIPASMIEERMDGIMKEYAQYMSQQGIGLEQYLKMIGSDVASFRETTRATAEKQTRTEVLLSAVADAENIQISEDDLKAEYAKMGEAYGMKAEEVEKYVDVEGLKADLRRRKAVDVIAESGVVAVTKAKKTVRKPADKKAEADGEAPAKKPRKTTKKAEEEKAE
ncbi:MAG: trigger factor [Oscillospiraceae bacterium]|nr:trigger factor [Oscillospiraceae bacterium]